MSSHQSKKADPKAEDRGLDSGRLLVIQREERFHIHGPSHPADRHVPARCEYRGRFGRGRRYQ
ncbi:MAG TPA: hypothetical protein VIC07_01720 [Acidimicrobiia bacterium]|jgi:hypothetical protein